MKKAIVFGASGLVGSYLVDELLNGPAYAQVTVVLRRAGASHHPKLKVLIADYATLPDVQEQLMADDVFIALGTTKAKTPDQAAYYQVDHDYPVRAAMLAKANGAKAVFVVSAVGAHASSKIFYVRTKGEMERDVTAVGLAYTHIFRPSMILGQRTEKRLLEKAMMGIWKLIDPIFVGSANRYRGIEAQDIARAMVQAARNNNAAPVSIYQWKEMKALL